MFQVDDGFLVVNLGFNFAYFSKTYTQVSISSNGYVFMGANSLCGQTSRPSPHDILVGLNYDLDTRRSGSGQIYYQDVSSGSIDFLSAKDYVNLLNSTFLPTNVFMITYDNVLPCNTASLNKTKFQIFLLSDNVKSYVIFKFTSCPTDLTLRGVPGLTHNYNDNLRQLIIPENHHCTSSNIGQSGVWVTEVTSYSLGKV